MQDGAPLDVREWRSFVERVAKDIEYTTQCIVAYRNGERAPRVVYSKTTPDLTGGLEANAANDAWPDVSVDFRHDGWEVLPLDEECIADAGQVLEREINVQDDSVEGDNLSDAIRFRRRGGHR